MQLKQLLKQFWHPCQSLNSRHPRQEHKWKWTVCSAWYFSKCTGNDQLNRWKSDMGNEKDVEVTAASFMITRKLRGDKTEKTGPHFLHIFQVPCYQSPTVRLHNCMDIQRKTTKYFGHQWLGMRIIINVITQPHTPSMNTNHSTATFSILCGTSGSWGTRHSWLRRCATSEGSQVRFSMVSLEFSIDIILLALLEPWGWLSL
jgi:hypothetical protein